MQVMMNLQLGRGVYGMDEVFPCHRRYLTSKDFNCIECFEIRKEWEKFILKHPSNVC